MQPNSGHYLGADPERLMTDIVILERTTDAGAQHASARADDAAMLKAAAKLTRGLNQPKPAVYWTDMLGSAALCLAFGASSAAYTVGASSAEKRYRPSGSTSCRKRRSASRTRSASSKAHCASSLGRMAG